MKESDESTPEVEAMLNELKPVQPRDARAAARGRARFLALAVKLQPVSRSLLQRLKIGNSIPRKERLSMNVVIAVFMALALVFGGGAATVQASQDDLPNQALYPVKLLVEDVRLWLTNDPEDEVSLLMEMVQTRVKELNMLASGGIVPPGEVTLRLEQQIRQALQVAAGLDRGDGQALLLQIRSQLEIQQQAMLHGEGEAAQIMTQTRTMLQEQLRLVDEGLVDPQHFQEMFRGEEQEPNRTGQGADSSPVPGDGGNGEGSPAGTGNPTAGPHSPGSPGSGPQATPGGQGGGNRP